MDNNIEIEKLKKVLTHLATAFFEKDMYNCDRPGHNTEQLWDAFNHLLLLLKPVLLDNTKEYYRARIIRLEDVENKKGFHIDESGVVDSGFNKLESGIPPKPVVKAGRANHQWEPVWYLSDDLYTSIAEVKPGAREQISVASYTLQESLQILDFSADFPQYRDGGAISEELSHYNLNELYTAIQKMLTLPTEGERTYYISNILVDMVKKIGVNGIKYKSFWGSGDNIVLWEKRGNEALTFIDSKVFINYCSNHAFVNILDKSIVDNSIQYERLIQTGTNTISDEVQLLYKEILRGNKL